MLPRKSKFHKAVGACVAVYAKVLESAASEGVGGVEYGNPTIFSDQII